MSPIKKRFVPSASTEDKLPLRKRKLNVKTTSSSTSVPLKKRKQIREEEPRPQTTWSSGETYDSVPKKQTMSKQACLENLTKLRNLRLLVDMAEMEVLHNLQLLENVENVENVDPQNDGTVLSGTGFIIS
mmetsp:Transcript_19640/g.33548  ORF Transcript_19640/g.33548 Transcript_19640/m.33548 type:complete len:130 (-) Transcript_19640:206-595(-)